jgi:hypothetical protein
LRNDVVIYEERFVWPYLHAGSDGDFLMIRISEPFSSDDSPEYELKSSFGPFGNYDFSGSLLSEETLLKFETITTQHFCVKAAVEFHEKFAKVANWLEHACGNMSQLLNETLSSEITADFQIRWGFYGGSNYLWFHIADVLMDHYSPSGTINSQLAMGGGLLHELAHVFQFSQSNFANKDNYYDPWWFGEPFASIVAADILGGVLDQTSREFAFGDRNRMFFDYLVGAPFSLDPRGKVPNSQHVIYHYLEKEHGVSIHQQMAKEWSNSSPDSKRTKLRNAGFDKNETYIILYSYLAGENLAWLYQVGGIDISEQRVNQGMLLLATETLDHVVVVDGKTFHVITESNSTVSNLVFCQGQICFNLTGETGNTGYCNVTIPKSLMNCTELDDWVIQVNSTPLSPPEFPLPTDNATHTFLYFTCNHQSTLQVSIEGTQFIPELRPHAILLLFTVATLLAVVVCKRRRSEPFRKQKNGCR